MNDYHWKTMVKAGKESRVLHSQRPGGDNLQSYSCSDSTKPKPHKPL